MEGENKVVKEKYNPGGSVPFILVDGKPMNESAAILRYLACQFPELRKFYSDFSLEQRCKIDAALDWNGTAYRKTHIGAFAPIVFTRVRKIEPSAEAFASAKESSDKLQEMYAT